MESDDNHVKSFMMMTTSDDDEEEDDDDDDGDGDDGFYGCPVPNGRSRAHNGERTPTRSIKTPHSTAARTPSVDSPKKVFGSMSGPTGPTP